MTEEPGLSKPYGKSGPMLLPPSGPLLPPVQGGGLLALKAEPGKVPAGDAVSGEAPVEDAAAGDLTARLGRAGAEARALASRAAALASQKAPELGKFIGTAGKTAGGIANRAFERAEASARTAGTAWADPEKRKAFLAANGKKLGITVATLAVILGGGWEWAGHHATAVARERLDTFLSQNRLQATLRYGGISASPFGSITLTDVVVKSADEELKAGAVEVSGLEMKDGLIRSIDVSADDVEVPYQALAAHGGLPVDLAGLGYTTLTGDLSFSGRIDDSTNTLSFDTRGEIRDLGRWKARIGLGGIDPAAIGALLRMVRPSGLSPSAGFQTELSAESAFGEVSLTAFDLTLDDSGYFERLQRVHPDEAAARSRQASAGPSNGETDALVRAGVSPGDAKADLEALGDWLRDGGRIRFEAAIDQPVVLFRRSFFGIHPAFDDPAEFVAATRMTISN